MDYGISPPDEYKMKIMKFLQHWGIDHIEPHILSW
jgi:hypothetical protein